MSPKRRNSVEISVDPIHSKEDVDSDDSEKQETKSHNEK